jgi:uncharacterized protein with HEPN domain
MKDEKILLEFILEAIDKIRRFTESGEMAFYEDVKTQDAVLRNFQTIGQAADDISDKTQEAHPEIEWGDIIGFRNVIVRDYLGLDLPTIWSIIADELPPLRQEITTLLKSL